MSNGTTSDQDASQQAAEQSGTQGAQQQSRQAEFEPITSQEEFDRRLSDRLQRERSKFSDYDDLKAKAEKFDEAEDAKKSELERLNDQLASEKQRADAAELERVRFKVASEKGVPASLLSGDDEAALVASADALIEFRGPTGSSGTPKPDATQGGGQGAPPALNSDGLEQALKSKLGIT